MQIDDIIGEKKKHENKPQSAYATLGSVSMAKSSPILLQSEPSSPGTTVSDERLDYYTEPHHNRCHRFHSYAGWWRCVFQILRVLLRAHQPIQRGFLS